jgi:hypothetical protein
VEKGTRAVKMCKMNNLYQGSPLLTVVFVNILGSNYLSYYAKAIFKVHRKERCNQDVLLPSVYKDFPVSQECFAKIQTRFSSFPKHPSPAPQERTPAFVPGSL